MPATSPQPLPRSPAQITPAFLAPVLRAAGMLQEATVTEVHVEPLAANVAFNAQIARLSLVYDPQQATAPRSLIAKLPPVEVEPQLQENAAVFRPGLKECWFYRHGAALTPVRVPSCYFGTVDASTGGSFLLLEDLAPAQAGDRLVGASLAQADLALHSLARLHAAWWGMDPAAEPDLALLIDNVEEAQSLVERLYHGAWPRFVERAPCEIPGDVRRFGERLAGRVAATEALLHSAPRTLIHGDYRLDNMLFGLHRGEPACWVIDWEDITLWNGMFDVAWFLGGCLSAEASAAEEELLRCYHQALVREGVGGYSWPQCRHEYRCAMFSAFVQGILTVASLEPADGYACDLARTLGQRFVAACQRLRLDELMPG